MAQGDPVIQSTVGRYLTGILDNDSLVQQYGPGGVWDSDPPQLDNTDWSSSGTYGALQTTLGSDGLPYRSLTSGNINHDPTTTSGYWVLAFPCVRFWCQSWPPDLRLQDGRLTRAMATPKYFVCAMDRQKGGRISKVSGTNGHLEDLVLRIHQLMDFRNETLTIAGHTYRIQMNAIGEYPGAPVATEGDFDVLLGPWLQLNIQ